MGTDQQQMCYRPTVSSFSEFAVPTAADVGDNGKPLQERVDILMVGHGVDALRLLALRV